MKIPNSIWTLLIGIALTLASLWYGQNHGLLPTAAADEAVLIDGLFDAMLTVSIGIFLLVEGILIYSVFKYRRRAGDNQDGPAIEGNIPLEILWTAIPAVIVLGISVYSFDVYNQIGGLDPHGGHDAPIIEEARVMPGTAIAATLSDKPGNTPDHRQNSTAPMEIAQAESTSNQAEPLVVEVSALQYAWIFTYPDAGITTGEIHVPVGQQVQMKMTANDVIHAFWVPEFRLKQDVIPGRETRVRFTPRKEGTYTVVCAELCGPYHGAMQTQIIVESKQAFDAWVQEQLLAEKETINQAIALNPSAMSADEFLARYMQKMHIHPPHLHGSAQLSPETGELLLESLSRS